MQKPVCRSWTHGCSATLYNSPYDSVNSYSATLKYLYGLQSRGMKFGLRNMRHLLDSAGNPETRFASIHIAGTNGKGSTSAFLASIAMEAGYATALYTSPHLVRFTERIRINGREIPERRLVDYAKTLRQAIEEVHATFFEATTCIAFQYFADEGVDVAIVEAGLGGRLDSTNVLTPLASVITNVGLDHTDILGKTIRSIAKEKGGIIKPMTPLVTGSEDPKALKVFQRIAKINDSPFQKASNVVKQRVDSGSNRVSFQSRSFSIPSINLGLAGPHQFLNARLALATIQVLKNDPALRSNISRVNTASVRRGLINVVRNTGLHGRLETFGRKPRYIMDVAHNPPGIRSLVNALRALGHKNLIVVFGVMKDKDYPAIVSQLKRIATAIVAVSPRVKRSLSARMLYRYIRSKGIQARLGGTVREGLKLAGKDVRHSEPIIVTGSHYVVGEALEFALRKRA